MSPSVASGPLADELSTSTKVSPRTPAVASKAKESLRRLKEYLVLTFIVTSTGVNGLPPTIRMPVTLPMSTPAKRTGAPSRRPPALSRYERSVILRVNHPPVPLITKIRTARVTLANRTVSPTRSCDHFSCFWLGKLVSKRQEHHSKHGGFRMRDFSRLGKTRSLAPTKASHCLAFCARSGSFRCAVVMIDDRCRLTCIAGLAMRTVVAVRLGFRLWPIRFFRSPRFGDRPLLNVPLLLNRLLLPLRRHVLPRPPVVAG